MINYFVGVLLIGLVWNLYDQISLFGAKPEPNFLWVAIDFWVTLLAIPYVVLLGWRWGGWVKK